MFVETCGFVKLKHVCYRWASVAHRGQDMFSEQFTKLEKQSRCHQAPTNFKQTETQKIVKCIYEIDYNLECHKLLFGNLPKEIIENYVKGVKSIPTNIKGLETHLY